MVTVNECVWSRFNLFERLLLSSCLSWDGAADYDHAREMREQTALNVFLLKCSTHWGAWIGFPKSQIPLASSLFHNVKWPQLHPVVHSCKFPEREAVIVQLFSFFHSNNLAFPLFFLCSFVGKCQIACRDEEAQDRFHLNPPQFQPHTGVNTCSVFTAFLQQFMCLLVWTLCGSLAKNQRLCRIKWTKYGHYYQ